MLKKFLDTILDIGFKRIIRRVLYEINLKLANLLPSRINYLLTKKLIVDPDLQNHLEELKLKSDFNYLNYSPLRSYTFIFLNEKKDLSYPINWNSSKWKRLWQFNLHYFDWLRKDLDEYLISKRKNLFLLNSKILIENWILSNPIGKGDGWHSYTISLRLRNWIWLLKVIPELENKKILESIWIQFLWLNNHKEYCYEGNHLIENITSLIISSLQFSSSFSDKIFKNSLKELESQLNKQILQDGGHEERSAYYHFLLLDRLIETACVINSINNQRPKFLVKKLELMLSWAELVILKNNKLPIFNDSPQDIIKSPDEIIRFAKSYLFKKDFGCKGLRRLLIKKSIHTNTKLSTNSKNIKKVISDLPQTGWTIIRPNNNDEFCFKNGTPCPKHLPPHVHSDLCSFTISSNGESILSNCGTSEYENTKIRLFERSAMAHNIFQLGLINKDISTNVKWIEPIEVWGSFRAGKKANVLNRKIFYETNKNIICIAGHNGFKHYGAKYKRVIDINIKNEKPIISIIDKVNLKYKMAWRAFYHLGPNVSTNFLNKAINKFENNKKVKTSWNDSWESNAFGIRIKRKYLCLSGFFDKGYNTNNFCIDLADLEFIKNEK